MRKPFLEVLLKHLTNLQRDKETLRITKQTKKLHSITYPTIYNIYIIHKKKFIHTL